MYKCSWCHAGFATIEELDRHKKKSHSVRLRHRAEKLGIEAYNKITDPTQVRLQTGGPTVDQL